MESITFSKLNFNFSRMMSMNKNDFERLNSLSEKALNDSATQSELLEFKLLLTSRNTSTELNLFGGFYTPDNVFQKPLNFK